METDGLDQALKLAIPDSLDNIIRKNRDQLTLRMSTPEELANLAPMVSMLGDQKQIRATILDWRVVCLDQHNFGKKHILVGVNGATKNVLATSFLKSFDVKNSMVLTENSIYKLGKKGEGEPTFHLLLHICALFHKWGFGQSFGVPHIFY